MKCIMNKMNNITKKNIFSFIYYAFDYSWSVKSPNFS